MSFVKQAPKRALLAMVAAAACGAAMAGGAEIAPQRGQHTDRLIIKYKEIADGRQALGAASNAVAQRVAQGKGLAMAELKTNALGAKVFKLSQWAGVADLQAMAAQIMAEDANVEYAEPDRLMYPAMTPNDTHYSKLWGLSSTSAGVRANVAWDTHTGSGVTVAVNTSADSGPMLMPGCACSFAAAPLSKAMSRLASLKRIGTLLKLSSRTTTSQRPSARTLSCWMPAAGSETRFTGPPPQEASARTAVAISAWWSFMAVPSAVCPRIAAIPTALRVSNRPRHWRPAIRGYRCPWPR